ncbi:uncharacterized protein G2W53_001847 [Senna tora]|uniref:RNase H type-1 domain-containing protein n=1 Tax=Senna tora TaxID=362788 RepID=A0A834XJH8_9FABA|nr:uncharacterized protein G2W53_001847 [Senna tora]
MKGIQINCNAYIISWERSTLGPWCSIFHSEQDRRWSSWRALERPNHRPAGSINGAKGCAGEGARSWSRRYSGARFGEPTPGPKGRCDDSHSGAAEATSGGDPGDASNKRHRREEESDRSSSESRSGESSSSSQSTDYTPPKKKKRYPFVDRIMDVVMPKLRTPTQLKHYDGASDPVAHVNSFKAAMLYAGALDEVMCRAFPSTLDGDAQLWTIKRTAHCLKNVVQGKEESLKDFLIRFTKATRQIQGLKMEVVLNYLTDNLRSKLFCCSITKKPPKTMAELLSRSTKYIAFEEVQQAKEGGQSKKEEAEPSRSRGEGYRRDDRREDRRDDRNRRERRQKPSRSFGPRFSSYTPLNQSQARILEEVHSSNILQYPPSKAVSTHADRNKYCKFHRNFGHDTEACAALKDQLEDLARKGLLKQYLEKGRQEGVGDRRDQRRDDRGHRSNDQRHREDNTDTVAGTIHVIAGGVVRGTEADPHTRKRQVRSVMRLEHEAKKPRTKQPSPQITFSDEDFAGEEERRPNPEGEMEAVALTEKDSTRTTKVGADLDPSLRKEAEYEALIAGLRLAKELGAKQATLHSDSQLVAGQLNGTFDVKEPTIARYVDLTRRLMAQFQKVVVERIPGRRMSGQTAFLSSQAHQHDAEPTPSSRPRWRLLVSTYRRK